MQMPLNKTAEWRLRRIIADLEAVASEVPTECALGISGRSPTSADGNAWLASADLSCIQCIRRRGAHSVGRNNGASPSSQRLGLMPVHPL